MIPHTLQIKNFLSYGSQLQTIDFGHYHLICLSGKNGHGKSALLDAMTWAVWGQARKTSGMVKPDQGLLRLGQTHMLVIFDFECNGEQYRIRREYTHLHNKPYAVLEFGLIDNNTKKLIPLTDKTIKTTQEKIEKTLRLDFESFVNSAFLRQGNANEFCKKSSKDRKEILATILGLNRYEIIRKCALNKIKEAQIQEHTLKAFYHKGLSELQKSEKIAQDLLVLLHEKNTLDIQEIFLLKQKNIFVETEYTITLNQQKIDIYQLQYNDIVKQNKDCINKIYNLAKIWRATRVKSKKITDLSLLEKQKNVLIQLLQDNQKALQESLEIQAVILTHKQSLHTLEKNFVDTHTQEYNKQYVITHRLYSDKITIEENIKKIKKEQIDIQREAISIEHDIKNLEKEISPQDILQREISLQEMHLEKRKELFQRLTAHGNILKNQLKESLHKQQLNNNDNDPSCPLCEQNLTAARRKFLRQKSEKREKFLQNHIKRLNNFLPQLKSKLLDQHNALTTLKKEYERSTLLTYTCEQQKNIMNTLEHKEKELKETLTTLEHARDQCIERVQQNELILTQKKDWLNNFSEEIAYKNIVKSIHALQEKLDKNVYNKHLYNQTLEELNIVEEHIKEHNAFLQEFSGQNQRYNTIKELCENSKQLKSKEKILHKNIVCLQNDNNKHRVFLHTQTDWQKDFNQFIHNKDQLLKQINQLKLEQDHLKQIELEMNALAHQSATLNNLIDDYQTIAHATGKDGIQALLIEDAIPEIESEANYLLSKLTNNQAQIFIESLRDLKSGGTKETLDIKISDQAGIRPYELFSGGEGFRIDFALRIAISKLLARRAGTALQTLIIDEGFGSQDEEGLAHIMDAIYKIQDDFARIIIVSHLPSLKDQFPVHFVVNKGPQGSQIEIMEHD